MEEAHALLTIDLAAIAANWRLLQARCGSAQCGAAVKADAYGLGMEQVAPALHAAGCRTFFVATVGEGIALRRLLPDGIIYVLHGPLGPDTQAFLRHDLRPVLNSLDQLAAWRAAADGAGAPPVALHLDSGMARLGLPRPEVATLLAEPDRLRDVDVALVMSHLACPDEPAHPLNAGQHATFTAALQRLLPMLRAMGSSPAVSFVASSGIFLGSDYLFDLTRPGAALYGVNPLPAQANPMRQVVTLKAKIIQTRCVDSGETVGYGATHRFTRPARLAVVGAGYADGYFRSLGSRGIAYIGEQRVPVVGRVSMDLITLDVSEVAPSHARPGAWVDLIGPHNPVDALAREAGTIGYEILTSLGRRYERRYLNGV